MNWQPSDTSPLEHRALLAEFGAFRFDSPDAHALPPPPLFHDLFPDDALILISGEPFTAKTMLLADSALLLDDPSTPLLGLHRPNGTRRVLFVGQDAPTYDYLRQFRKLATGHGWSSADLHACDVALLLNRNISLLDPRFQHWLDRLCRFGGLSGLMLDTLFTCLPDIDENSNTAMTAVMKLLKHWRDDYGLFVMFTMHTSKSSGFDLRSANYRVRGASAIAASCDFHLQLIRRSSSVISLTVAKGRGDIVHTVPTLQLLQGSDWVRLIGDAPDEERVLSFLANQRQPFVSLVKLLRQATGGKDLKPRVRLALQKLETSGQVSCIGDDWWALTRPPSPPAEAADS